MATIETQPLNPNYLFATNFRFTMLRAPNIVFYAQKANLPGLSIEVAEQGSPYGHIYRAGHKMDFNEFEIEFPVDEDMENYLEIFNWMIGLGFPDTGDEYAALVANPISSGKGLFSDGTLTLLSSAKNPNLEIQFTDMFPISLSNLDFDTTDASAERLKCTVTFKYQRFFIKKL